MDLRFRLSRTLEAPELRVPFALHWTPSHGSHVLTAEINLRRDPGGTGWLIPAETLFSVIAEPGVQGFASGTLTLQSFEFDAPCAPDWVALHRAFWHASGEMSSPHAMPFGRALAQAMFRTPDHAWTLDEVALAVDASARNLQMRLFREAYSFASTLRRCRALRVFLATLSPDMPLPGSAISSQPVRSF